MRQTVCDKCHRTVRKDEPTVTISTNWPWQSVELCGSCGKPALKRVARLVKAEKPRKKS
jgi:hypothetical protein